MFTQLELAKIKEALHLRAADLNMEYSRTKVVIDQNKLSQHISEVMTLYYKADRIMREEIIHESSQGAARQK